jgi:branched-chain amino acid transport system permease protein
MKPGFAKFLPIIPVLLLYALLFALGCAAQGNWQLAAQIAFYCALAGAFNMFMGLTGYVDFGYVAFVGVGSYGMAFAISSYAHLGPWVLVVGLTFSLLAATLLALTVGAVALRLRGAYFAIATVGVNEGLRYLIEGARLFRGSQGLLYSQEMNAAFTPEGAMAMQTFWADVAVFAVAVTAAIVTLMFLRGKVGFALIALREDETAAQAIGIPTTRYKLTAFLASAILAGLLGAAKALKTPHLYPIDAFYVHYTIEAIIIVVLGGAGTLSGPILGATVYSLAKYYLSIYLPGFQLLLFSPLLIAAVVLFPAGIVGNMKRYVAGTWLEGWVL